MKRIVLFLATNVAVLVVLSVVLKLFGLDRVAYGATGLDYGSLLALSAVSPVHRHPHGEPQAAGPAGPQPWSPD